MVAKAEAKYLRISPRKVRQVIELIKTEKVKRAFSILQGVNKKGAYYLQKVLKSAVSNAKNKGYDEDVLFISKLVANPGPIIKRYRAASFGRAVMIRRRTAHILVELDSLQFGSEVKVK